MPHYKKFDYELYKKLYNLIKLFKEGSESYKVAQYIEDNLKKANRAISKNLILLFNKCITLENKPVNDLWETSTVQGIQQYFNELKSFKKYIDWKEV